MEEMVELNHLGKLIGILKNPMKTFHIISYSQPKKTDWIIPITVYIIIAVISHILLMSPL